MKKKINERQRLRDEKIKKAYDELDMIREGAGSDDYKCLTESIVNLEKADQIAQSVKSEKKNRFIDIASRVAIPIITIVATIGYSVFERNQIYKEHGRNNFITDPEEKNLLNTDSRNARNLLGKKF